MNLLRTKKLLILMFNTITKIFIIVLFFSTELNAACTGDVTGKEISKIEFIKIEKANKFFSRIGKYYLESEKRNKDQIIKINIKKKHNAVIKTIYNNQAYCLHNATMRFHGDGIDHISIINGTPIPSLRIKLKDTNINNVVRFILFRPVSRYFDGEIFSTVLFRNMGFLSPRTFKVNVKINGIDTEYIFQENLKKEFLENNSRIEGPILESKEDYHNFNIFQLSRISNSEWIKDNLINKLTSLEANRLYNKILLKSKIFFLYDELLRFDPKDFDENNYQRLSEFDALSMAVGIEHALTFYNRRFYYDPINKIIEPIYYDGMSKILSEINYDVFSGKYKKNIYNYQRMLKLNFKSLDGENFNESYQPPKNYSDYIVLNSAKFGADKVITKLNNLDRNKILTELHKNGFTNINLEQLEVIINKILQRLKLIQNSPMNNELDHLFIKKKSYQNQKFNREILLVFLRDKNILNCIYDSQCNLKASDLLDLEFCNLNLSTCNNISVNNNDFIKLLEQDHIFDDYNIFLNIDKNEYANAKIFDFYREGKNKLEKLNLTDNIKIFYNSLVDINYDDSANQLTLNYKNSNGRVVFLNSRLENIKIKMVNQSIPDITKYKKNYNLTGCLTVIDTHLKNTSFSASDFNCEDTINFVRSHGDIYKIEISNSNSDGIDADFSNLKFKEIFVKKARNDCIDFSYGEYKIENVNLNNCGDKAISVGEKSILQSNKINIENANIGIASKDSSKALLEKININKVVTCLTSYKKKQEFDGGYILAKKFICKNFEKQKFNDDYSKITIIN